ncbi:uncharacterized protein M421DRAFT_426699 [Didymella exigua CBS 183.55]|uniref:Zn(2)-C6 fungal-type domain-containing protein n=1 Tax=Didymella exigua CBS 183.55 TaxID=1150837 RepID=A0A6A5R5C5_9PLEO|nr:uncharacterized protein M421DRAFT_426699 [Didymella exigua CBS 183.55]KAF1922629.1 hypothetical protein M421DRAFT_426699 [Didymella exigua CBS 183.55]
MNITPSVTPYKEASSHRRNSDPSIGVMSGEGPPKETCSRVRRACNRCRLKKVKCDGHIPCARCEQDHATCKINYDATCIKDLRKNYIANLEEQQISLLGALRDLHRKLPLNIDVCDTVEQLQREGFDIESVRFKDPHRDSQKDESFHESVSPKTAPQLNPWEPEQLTMDYLQSLLEQPATPPNLTWHCGDTTRIEAQHHPQPTRWDSAGSVFGTTVPQNIHSIVDPLSGRFINLSTASFGAGDLNMILS